MTSRPPEQAMAAQIIDLWDARTTKGLPFLASQEDVEPMRRILEGQVGTNDLWAKLDNLLEQILDGRLNTLPDVTKAIEEIL